VTELNMCGGAGTFEDCCAAAVCCMRGTVYWNCICANQVCCGKWSCGASSRSRELMKRCSCMAALLLFTPSFAFPNPAYLSQLDLWAVIHLISRCLCLQRRPKFTLDTLGSSRQPIANRRTTTCKKLPCHFDLISLSTNTTNTHMHANALP
jgi:hypothetical protein